MHWAGKGFRIDLHTSQTILQAGWKISGTVNQILLLDRGHSNKILVEHLVCNPKARSKFQISFTLFSLLKHHLLNLTVWLSFLDF